jgi:HD-GYP domain-containing protein (c-di-GMP phosphodiesterase class II)
MATLEQVDVFRRSLFATIQVMSLALESRDPKTDGHQRRVSAIARALANEMGLSREQVDGIRFTGLIHDLGLIAVPVEIITKDTSLTEAEIEFKQYHPSIGYDLLKGIEFPWPVAQSILQHHERLDGSGYPDGISGDAIIIEARILAVADTMEVLTASRRNEGLTLEEALKEIIENGGRAYDLEVIEACKRVFKIKEYEIETMSRA